MAKNNKGQGIREEKSGQTSWRKPVPSWVWYALCFLVPAAVMTWAYWMEGFYPFGDKSILAHDMGQQYVEYFCALKSGDVFFSWSKALGTSYIGVFSYYVSSPLSLLTLLVPNDAMPLGLMALVILKLGLAGLSYGIFTRHYFDRLDLCTLLCAVGYALCTYAVAYSMCVMWLDGLIWLPIILLGLEWLLKGQRRWLFPVSLAVCFVSTWYISYMIGGFCCLWFLFRVCAKGLDVRTALRRLRDFLLSAVWALCLTAWLWLPSFLAMTSGKLSVESSDWRGTFTFFLPDMMRRFFYGDFEFFYNNALPYVFFGTGLFLAAVGYFFLKNLRLRERLAAAGVAAALVASMWISGLDRVWHIFQVPNHFPYRYAFLLSFFLVFLAHHTLRQLQDALEPTRPAALALALLLCWEMGTNAQLILQTVDRADRYQLYSDYVADYTANMTLVSVAKEDAQDDSFYRMGADYDRGLNGPLSFGYNGITHYSSLYNSKVNNTLRSLGMAQTWYWVAYYGSSHFTDALFDVRYVLSHREVPGYEAMGWAGELGLYQDPNTLPLAFVPRQAPAGLEGNSPVQRQNSLFSALTGDERELFSTANLQVQDDESHSVITFYGSGEPVYLDLTSWSVTDLRMNGQSLFLYDPGSSKTRMLHCVGAPGVGETLEVTVDHSDSWDGASNGFVFHPDVLEEGVEQLRHTAQITSVTNGRVKLTAFCDRAGKVVTTIPAEAGWRAWVDGSPAELSTWLDDTFLALEIDAGEHQIILRFTPPGLLPGLALGALALAWAGGAWLLLRKKKGTLPTFLGGVRGAFFTQKGSSKK